MIVSKKGSLLRAGSQLTLGRSAALFPDEQQRSL